MNVENFLKILYSSDITFVVCEIEITRTILNYQSAFFFKNIFES